VDAAEVEAGDVDAAEVEGAGEDGAGVDVDVDGVGGGVVDAEVVGVGVGVGVLDTTGCVVDGDGDGDGRDDELDDGEGDALVGVGSAEDEVGDDEGCTVVGTSVGVTNDGAGVAVTPAIGGKPAEELLIAVGAARPEASADPIICGLPLLLRLPLLGAFDEEKAAPRGAEAAGLRRNPGCTKPSTSSAASDPPPAIAARRAFTRRVAAAAPPRWVPRLPPRRRVAGAPACDRPGAGIVRKSSMTCSFSSALARIGSSSGAHRAIHASRRSRQAKHSVTWRVTLNRRSAGNTTLSGRTPSRIPPSR